MSVFENEAPQTQEPRPGSLAARMAERRERSSETTEEVFPIPGWEDMLGARLCVLGWRTTRSIGERHAKIKDQATQELYVAADTLLAATRGFVEILPDGSYADLPNETWESLARRGVQSDELPDELTSRRAMIALLRDDIRIPLWFADWQQWVQSARIEPDEGAREDFS